MFLRIGGILVLTGAIMFGVMGVLHAQPTLGTPGGTRSPNAAPELDPNALGSAFAMLAGGVFLLNERRRKTC